MSTDYAVEVRVKNNWFLTKMRAAGFATASQLSNACGVSKSQIGKFINLKEAPLTMSDEWRKSLVAITNTLRCLSEDLFPPQHLRDPLKSNRAEIEMSAADVRMLLAPQACSTPEDRMIADESVQALTNALSELPPREERVLRLYYGLNGDEPMTLDELGQKIGSVTRERARQILSKAERHLRHPSKAAKLRAALVGISAGQ